ncbi:DNA helicase/exodeoxyribonuclease V, alpha subunit [Formivibrio citricus]|uniref:RecBCD enzyme subunit RecD n=1 Tax=Formivibrio citricus TaxID=83765 RepID=A0A1I4V782_9NEIS|nr:exodeoxyribonuclease V subunit alpha [Formivibrio citricus]SFM97034.1 DNA helicase/exodeoxyribonuclease V, alpha subunit [Formivibrio citricus]
MASVAIHSSYVADLDLLLQRTDDEAAKLIGPWLQRLASALDEGHCCVECADELPVVFAGGPGAFTPLVHDGSRLYFARHWQEESTVASRLLALAKRNVAIPANAEKLLAGYFPEGENGQKQAAHKALSSALTVIAGGPGTGKTTTVMRLLAVLLASAPAALKVCLAAPTGKAAQRMSESVRLNKNKLDDLFVRDAIPETALTLHRLLGYNPDTGRVRNDAANPLDLDLLVVDEASMIDLGLMARLLAALPAHARLILLGDPDQLPSVDAGSVFSDLCALSTGPVASRVVRLRYSHRFGCDSGIGELARSVNAGDVPAMQEVLAKGYPDLEWRESWCEQELSERACAGYAAYRNAVLRRAPVAEVFAAFNDFRLLCCRREGARGVAKLNSLVQQTLFGRSGEWFAGRPVMVTCNDYNLQLFNGDIGIVLEGPDGLMVWFESEGGSYRSLHPSRIPSHETAFALTVHKSQGSEFSEVLLVLPEEVGQGEARNLVYTALTRARQKTALWAQGNVLAAAVSAHGGRLSGLGSKLQGLQAKPA